MAQRVHLEIIKYPRCFVILSPFAQKEGDLYKRKYMENSINIPYNYEHVIEKTKKNIPSFFKIYRILLLVMLRMGKRSNSYF